MKARTSIGHWSQSRLLKDFLKKYNSRSIKITISKCPTQWVWYIHRAVQASPLSIPEHSHTLRRKPCAIASRSRLAPDPAARIYSISTDLPILDTSHKSHTMWLLRMAVFSPSIMTSMFTNAGYLQPVCCNNHPSGCEVVTRGFHLCDHCQPL